MRICMIMATPLPPQEGVGFYVWNLSRQLVRRGHQVQIITRGSARTTTREVIDGLTIWRPTFLPVFPLHVHLHSLFVNRLVKQLESHIDVFHLHSPLVRIPKTSRPCLLTIHSLMKTASAALKLDSLLSVLTKLQTPVSVMLEQELLQQVAHIGCVARQLAGELQAAGIDPAKISVFANGVDPDIFYPLAAPPRESAYALTVGRLSPGKGLEDLLPGVEAVIRQYPHLRFLIVGEGPLREKLEHEINRRKLHASIILVGHIADREELADLYRGAALYIHPSHYEGVPTALLEAMACGCPAIATDVGGVSNVLHDESNGLLVESRNPAQLTRATLRVLGDPELADRLGRSAAQTIATQYAWTNLGKKYLSCYQTLASGAA
jgi:glycosyltransferase involved in cell wall biosynthesis